MKLWFDSCDWGDDFEAYCDLPKDWYGEDDTSDLYNNGFIWFKAYDLAAGGDFDAAKMMERGCRFECLVRFQYDPPCGPYDEETLAEFYAKDKEEAERLLQIAADALYGEE